jgi:hypothetical protein
MSRLPIFPDWTFTCAPAALLKLRNVQITDVADLPADLLP